MAEKEPLTLKEFFQALADGKTEFAVKDSYIIYNFNNYEFTCAGVCVPINLIGKWVESGEIFLHEKPKRLLTPDDVGRVVKDSDGKIALITSWEPSPFNTYEIDKCRFNPEGKSIVSIDIGHITDIRNDKGEWEKIG